MCPVGDQLATASEFGTVVKVWRRCDAELLYRLRVGAPSIGGGHVVSCIAFRSDGAFVAVATATSPSVHVFRLGQLAAEAAQVQQEPQEEREAVDSGSWGFGKALSSLTAGLVKGAVPGFLTDLQSC